MDALGPNVLDILEEPPLDDEEFPNPQAKIFFDMLDTASKPFYEGTKMTLLETAARITTLKCEYNLAHRCVDGIASLIEDANFLLSNKEVKKAVTKAIKAHYTRLCYNWRETPLEIRNLWFNNFKSRFTYAEEDEAELRRAFNKKCQERLKDMIYHIGGNDKEGNEKGPPDWMSPTIFNKIKLRRETNEWKKKSSTAKKNKRANSEGGKIMPTHHMGSISAIEQAAKMTRDANGNPPTAASLFTKVHSKGGKLTTKKAQTVLDNFNAMKTQLEEQGSQINEEELFYKAVGGRKKGKVYGVGSAQDMYYANKPYSSTATSSTANSYAPGILTQVTADYQEYKTSTEARIKMLEDASKEERDKRQQLEAQLAFLYDKCKDIHHFRDPQDPFDDGGSGANASLMHHFLLVKQ